MRVGSQKHRLYIKTPTYPTLMPTRYINNTIHTSTPDPLSLSS